MKKSIYLKVIAIIILIIIFITLIICFIMSYNQKQEYKQLIKKGYKEEQVNLFYQYSFDTKKILKHDYCEDIDEILTGDFQDDIDIYLNNCFLKMKEETEFLNKLKKEKYYIEDNLDRYLNYNDGIKTTKDIVTEVNCNLDKEFYKDIIPTNLNNENLMLVNKYYYLDENYEPKNPKTLSTNYTYWSNSTLNEDAYNAFIEMVDDAKELGYSLIDTSAFRTYSYQSYLFNKYLAERGLEETLKSSAKPGHSEHQTGLATDIVKPNVSMYDFKNTAEFAWLKENSYKYGFILRYPEGKEYLTGYKYEPWHYRYVGVETATYIYENDIVFEEYYAYFCEYKKSC